MDVDLQGTHEDIRALPFGQCTERRAGAGDRVPSRLRSGSGVEEGVLGGREKQIPESVSVGLWRDNTFFSLAPDLTSLLTGGRPAGVHLSGLQPSAGQFLASLDPINEASAILSPLSSNREIQFNISFKTHFQVWKPWSARLTLRLQTPTLQVSRARGLAIPG